MRIRADLNAALTEAIDDSGLGPQDIVEEALADWLVKQGHLKVGGAQTHVQHE